MGAGASGVSAFAAEAFVLFLAGLDAVLPDVASSGPAVSAAGSVSSPVGMASLLSCSSGTAVSSGRVSFIPVSSPADSSSVETGSAGVEISALSSVAEKSVPASTLRVSGFSPSIPVSSVSGTFSVSMSSSWRMFSSVTTVSSVFAFLGIVNLLFCYFTAGKAAGGSL